MTAEAAVWDDLDAGGTFGEELARDLRDMVRAYDEEADRSKQRHIGPSEIGTPCTRCLARKVLGLEVERAFDDPWCRILGTAGHAWLDEAAEAANVRANECWWLPEVKVYPENELMPKGGKADLYDMRRFTVVDHKIVGLEQLRKYRLNGPGPRYRYQGQIYGLGYSNAGRRVDHVAVAFWPRGGTLSQLYVWTEPYDEAVAQEALSRYRLIRDQALALGSAIIPLLPADADCWDCGGKDAA